MRKFLTFIPILLLSTLSCLNPGRDNPYDPNNPDKVYLGGTVYGINYHPIDGAAIKLIQDGDIIEETQSEVTGWYEFTGVDPGIYRLIAEADLYTPLEYDMDFLAGAKDDSFDLYFQEIFFDFENEPLGPTPPRGFLIKCGQWDITQDNTDPGVHSVPKVFRGTNVFGAEPFALALFKEPIKDFWVDAKVKYSGSSTGSGAFGFVLRAQDEHNFYLLVIDLQAEALGLFTVLNDIISDTLAVNNTLSIEPDTWYCLAVDFKDSDIEVHFNETRVFELSDDTFEGGSIGLWVKSWEMGGVARAHFDDMGIWP